MSALALMEERVLFSPNLPVEVNMLLQAAVAASSVDQQQAEKLFLQAKSLDSQCLQTYFALYKFYFFQKRLVDAERIVFAGLEESAKQGGFSNNYQQLAADCLGKQFYSSESQLFYLYTLKALAFIKLRQGLEAEAQLILLALQALDPEDRSGASVIMDLAAAVAD